MSARSRAGLRGLGAAASLKRDRSGATGRGCQGFRGLGAAASSRPDEPRLFCRFGPADRGRRPAPTPMCKRLHNHDPARCRRVPTGAERVDALGRGGDDGRHSQRSTNFPRQFLAWPCGVHSRRRRSPSSTAGSPLPTPPPPTCDRCRSRWRKKHWRPAIPLDDLAAHLDPGYKYSIFANDIVPHAILLDPQTERLIQFGGVDAVQDGPFATTIVSPSMTLTGPVRRSVAAERQNGDETSAAAEWHRADTARSLSYGRPVARTGPGIAN